MSGPKIRSKASTAKYRDGYDRIFDNRRRKPVSRYIVIEYDPETVGVDEGDLFSYLQNELDNAKIKTDMKGYKTLGSLLKDRGWWA